MKPREPELRGRSGAGDGVEEFATTGGPRKRGGLWGQAGALVLPRPRPCPPREGHVGNWFSLKEGEQQAPLQGNS